MYNVLVFIEKVLKYIRIKMKICYWKLKYGRRIQIGKNLKFRKDLRINIAPKGFLKLGDNNFFNNYCSINCHEYISIGNDNLFGENVKIYDHNHTFNNKNVNIKTTYISNKIKIGDKNWFCTNTVILSKADVGNENVISAGVILNKKIESNKLIRKNNKLIEEEIIYKNK